jgi:hypothetical protein
MLPYAPNTVTVTRPAAQDGDYEDSDTDDIPETVAAAWSVAITAPSGSDLVVSGQKEIVDAKMIAPVTPVLEHTDLVVDDDSGESYRVVWVRRRRGLGLDHQIVGLRSVVGGAL